MRQRQPLSMSSTSACESMPLGIPTRTSSSTSSRTPHRRWRTRVPKLLQKTKKFTALHNGRMTRHFCCNTLCFLRPTRKTIQLNHSMRVTGAMSLVLCLAEAPSSVKRDGSLYRIERGTSPLGLRPKHKFWKKSQMNSPKTPETNSLQNGLRLQMSSTQG